MPKKIFVLDIGTRSVMALLAHLEDDELVVSHLIYKEHKTRSMLDGQIHDVEQVVILIRQLVEEMEKVSGQSLKEVSVAAAGRSLKTVVGTAKLKYPASALITKEDALALELQAVQEAQLALPKEQSGIPLSQQYYCVGYSIVDQRLDGISLVSIVGQRGQTAEIEVVSTFLPRIVVDSLQSAVERAGKELASITLEPIAVANLVLTPAMRRLNLVLVDIGAGTSDIAVCGKNSISAFGMVPMAGDEITEALCDSYLLDFNRGEEAKRLLQEQREIQSQDVLGFEQTLASQEVEQALEPAVTILSKTISEEIIRLNSMAPQAVLLVGGGSLTPGLPKKLAQILSLPENRVAVQQASKAQHVRNLPEHFSGPNFITVLGIAYTGLTCPTMGFISVNVNGIPIRLLNLIQNNVAEALLAGGYNIRDLYGRPGMAITCELNGQIFTLPGKPGKMGSISLNGKKAQLADQVKQGDEIVFDRGIPGADAMGTFRTIIKELIGSCTLNGKLIELNPLVEADGKKVSLEDPVPDGSKIKTVTDVTVEQILKLEGLADEIQTITVNQKKIRLLDLALLKKNGKKTIPGDKVSPGDHILFEPPANLLVADFIPSTNGQTLEVTVNGRKVILNGIQVTLNGKKVHPATPVKDGDKVEYKIQGEGRTPILIDVFNIIDFSPTPPRGKTRLNIAVNNQEKEYTYELQHGDDIVLEWY